MLGCALPMRLGTWPETRIVERLVGEHADLAVDQRGVHQAAAAGARALVQRGEDAHDRIDPGEDVGDRNPGALRLAIGQRRSGP